MGRINEYIARPANKEDQVKGLFWEARFESKALPDFIGSLKTRNPSNEAG